MTQKLEILLINQIKPHEQNARTHPDFQIDQIARSIEQFGNIMPIVVDRNNRIIAGHGRYLALLKLGFKKIPVLRADHLTENEARAYRLADNKIAENAGWNKDLLVVELSYLLEVETEFDISITGFSTAEVDVIVSDQCPDDFEEPVLLPEPDAVISRPGDIWICSEHRVGVGDLRDAVFVRRVLDDATAQMTCNDPPYNVTVKGHISGRGKAQHGEFAMASGEMSPADYLQFLLNALIRLACVGVDGSLHYVFMDWRHLQVLMQAGNEVFDQFINMCVWVKTNAGMGALYRSQYEVCLVFKKGKAPHINNVELGRHGRNRTNVWTYAGMNSFGKDRDELLACHPTVKPVRMIADAIMDVTHHDDIVFDGFLGSGTTLLAADQTHRICCATEIDPRYVDVALRRWMNATGRTPVLEGTGQSFDEVAAGRQGTQEVSHD